MAPDAVTRTPVTVKDNCTADPKLLTVLLAADPKKPNAADVAAIGLVAVNANAELVTPINFALSRVLERRNEPNKALNPTHLVVEAINNNKPEVLDATNIPSTAVNSSTSLLSLSTFMISFTFPDSKYL